jgi:hypothetical protein
LQAQDEFAALSHEKATRAKEQGLFDKEIVPVRPCRILGVESRWAVVHVNGGSYQ